MAAKVEDPAADILYGPSGRRVLTLKSTPGAPKKGVVEGAKDIAASVQHILAPATVGEGRGAAATIRRASAEGDLASARAANAGRSTGRVSKLSRAGTARAGGLHREPLDARGRRLRPPTLADPKLQKAADDIRKVNETYRQRIEDSDRPRRGADVHPRLLHAHVEGSPAGRRRPHGHVAAGLGRNLKARSIPTLQEGIDAGLTPVTENPIEATMIYADNMSRYLATVDAQAEMASSGMSGWFPTGRAPQGWTKLEGIRTDRPGRLIVKDGETVANVPGQQPLRAGRCGQGLQQLDQQRLRPRRHQGAVRPDPAQDERVTMLKLGLSAFHATTMAQEGGDLGDGARLRRAVARRRGHGGQGGGRLAAARRSTRALRGDRMRNELLSGVPKDVRCRRRSTTPTSAPAAGCAWTSSIARAARGRSTTPSATGRGRPN
jgi:hypothetical protein